MTTQFSAKPPRHGGVLHIAIPDADAHSIITVTPGSDISLNFDPGIAKYAQEGGDLVFSFANNSTVTFTGFFALEQGQLPHFVLPDGSQVSAQEFFANTVLAATCSGTGAILNSEGISEYQDDVGDLISGVDRLGALGTDHWSHDAARPASHQAQPDAGQPAPKPQPAPETPSITDPEVPPVVDPETPPVVDPETPPVVVPPVTGTLTGVDTTEADENSGVEFVLRLSAPPEGECRVLVVFTHNGEVIGEQWVSVGADGKAGFSFANPNGEDAYRDSSQLTATVKEVQGGYEHTGSLTGLSGTAHIADTIDTTEAGLSVSSVENDRYEVTVSVSNPAPHDIVLTLSNGETITIPAGQSQASRSYEYKPGMDTTISITGVEGYQDADGDGKTDYTTAPSGGYEALDFSEANGELNLPPDARDDAEALHQGDSSVTGNLLGNDSDPDGDQLTVVGAGQGTGHDAPVGPEGVTVSGQYGTVTIFPDGSYTYTVDPDNDAVKNLEGSLSDTFTYQVSDGKGGYDTAELEITIGDSRFISGDNLDNVIDGGSGHDAIIGDTGGVGATPDASYNVALIVDTSQSMSSTAMAQAKDALKNLVAQLAAHGDGEAEVNLVIIDFDDNATFLWHGSLNSGNLNDVLTAIDKMSSGGGTNYEAGFNAANKWFGSLGNAATTNENEVYFITDGQPTYYYKDYVTVGSVRLNLPGDFISGDSVYWDADGNLLDGPDGAAYRINGAQAGVFVNLEAKDSGDSWNKVPDGDEYVEFREFNAVNSDAQSQDAYQRLLDSLGGKVNINAIGIGSETNKDLLDPYDNTGGAQIISDAGELEAALKEASEDKAEVGADTIHGGAGHDIIFGDAINADHLLPADTSGANAWADGLKPGDSLALLRAYLASGMANGNGISYTTGPGGTVTNDDIRRYVQAHAFELARADEGQDKSDTLYGDEGNDILFGQGGNDALSGGAGNDILVGGTGGDILSGGEGADVFLFHRGDGNDTITDFNKDDGDIIVRVANGSGSFGTIDTDGRDMSGSVYDVHDVLQGHNVIGLDPDKAYMLVGAGVDGAKREVGGVSFDNILQGGNMNDVIIGGMGSNLLVGGAGDDYIQGGSGNDIIYGGAGDDILFGGGGKDVFVWTADDLDGSTDRIMDFSFAEGDRLNLSNLLSPEQSLEDLLGMFSVGSIDSESNSLSLQVSKGSSHVDISVNFQGDELRSFVDTYVERHGDTSGLDDALLAMMIQNANS